MKIPIPVFACIFIPAITLSNLYAQKETAGSVLQHLLDKLNSYDVISYHYHRSINYISENYHNEGGGNTFLDFKNGDTIVGFRFQLDNESSKIVYNGTESFTINKKDSTINVRYRQQPNFANLSLFLNSIPALKGALPAIIADAGIVKTLHDTTINEKDYYLASFILQNKTLSGLGKFDPTTLTRSFLYRIIIDKKTFLPLHIIQTNDVAPKDYMLTSFSGFSGTENIPTDYSWYYSSYTTDYKSATEKKLTLIAQGSVAPDWQATYFDSKDDITLSKLRGNLVLLEFWIKDCGHCIESVPKLNALIEKHKDLKVVGINTLDSKKNMEWFYANHHPKFKTVNDKDGKIMTDYGVEGFPMFVLIDPKGTVLYSGIFDEAKLEGLVRGR